MSYYRVNFVGMAYLQAENKEVASECIDVELHDGIGEYLEWMPTKVEEVTEEEAAEDIMRRLDQDDEEDDSKPGYDTLVCTAVKRDPYGFIDLLYKESDKTDYHEDAYSLLREAACVIANLLRTTGGQIS